MTIKDTYTACSIAEGFDGQEHDSKTTLKAWAYLIRTGQVWHLQGWYGRTATDLIQQGFISRGGQVQWKYIDNLVREAAEAHGL